MVSEHGVLFRSLIIVNKFKTCVEIGIAGGKTSKLLCQAVEKVGGHLYGFDIWSVHGIKDSINHQYCEWYEKEYGSSLRQVKQYKQKSSKKGVENFLKSNGLKSFTMTKIDTKSPEFPKVLKSKCPKIDFAFIDGDHSYNGVKHDFDAVYPLISKTGVIAFHDTQKIDGSREFMLDLRTKYYDGTYDIVDFPFGNGKRNVGVSLLVKRSFPILGTPIDEMCGSNSMPHEILEKEKNWYNNEIKKWS